MAISADYQVETNGTNSLLMGPGTNYEILNFDRFLSRSVKRSDSLLAGRHGGFLGPRYVGSDDKILEVLVKGTSQSDLHTKIDTLRAAFTPEDTSISFRMPGPKVRRFYGWAADIDPQIDLESQATWRARVRCQFTSDDGIAYDDTATSNVYSPSETASLTNSGNVASVRWEASFAAGSTGAKLLHNGSGLYLDFDGVTISSTAYVATGHDRRVLQSTTNKYGDLTATSEFFSFLPGANSLTFTVDSGTGDCTVSMRGGYA